MDRYAVINSDNVVVNVVIWDGGAQWAPPAGTQAVLGSNRPEMGYIYNPQDGTFAAPQE